MFGCDWWIFNCIVIPTKWIYFSKCTVSCLLRWVRNAAPTNAARNECPPFCSISRLFSLFNKLDLRAFLFFSSRKQCNFTQLKMIAFSTSVHATQHDRSVKIIISYLNRGKLLNESTVFWFDWSVGMTDSSHAGSSRKERVCICSMMAGWMVAWLISGDSQATTPTWHWRQKQHASWTKLTQRKCSSL